MEKKEIGKLGESIAVEFLKLQNFEIEDRNYYIKGGELDIVASKDKTIHFVEVKTRFSNQAFELYNTVGYSKIKHIKLAAKTWFFERNMAEPFWQIDFIAIILTPNFSLRSLDYIENIGM